MNKVICLIPAYNEAERIGNVIQVVKKCTFVDNIYVIDDGSTDSTCETAKSFGVEVFRLEKNMGKAYALLFGVKNTQSEIILMLDADLINLEVGHIDALIKPVLENEADMSIGIFTNGRFSTDFAQFISPFLSGQRALKRYIFDNILESSDILSSGYAIEVILSNYAKKEKLKVVEVSLPKVTHVMKEEKMGFFKGTQARMKMYKDIMQIIVKSNKK